MPKKNRKNGNKDQSSKQISDKNGDKGQSAKEQNGKNGSKDNNSNQKSDKNGDKNQSAKEQNGGKGKISKQPNGKTTELVSWAKEQNKTFAPLNGKLEKKVQDLIGLLHRKMKEIRKEQPIDWQPYMENKLITHMEFSFMDSMQHAKTREDRDMMVNNFFKDVAYEAFTKFAQYVHVVDEMRKLLVLTYDFLAEDKDRIEALNAKVNEPWKSFKHLLNCADEVVQHMASRIIVKLLCADNGKPKAREVRFVLEWMKNELRLDNDYLQSVASCLQRLLRVNKYRISFMNMDGVHRLVNILSEKLRPQLQYQFCFCVWVTTFNPDLVERIHRSRVIRILMAILQSCPAEITKLPRIILATVRNLLEKPQSKIRRENALFLIQRKIFNYLDIIEARLVDTNDPEYTDDFQRIRAILSSIVTEASSFEEYFIELHSGILEWSVVHTSKRFWVENAERLHENKFELLKILISYLEESKNKEILCVAAHDLGEYMKQYNRGKRIVESLGGKVALLRLLTFNNTPVRYHALKSLQIMMLNNYDMYSEFQNVTKKLSVKWTNQISFGL